jgi:hypothetical protein
VIRSCVWLCTLTAAATATVSDARAFAIHGHGTSMVAHFVAGPDPLHGPGAPPVVVKPPAPPSGNYSFSGNSFNLSVTRNGRSGAPPPPPVTAPGGAQHPGFFQRLFNWW